MKKDRLLIIAVSLVPTLLLWVPFYLRMPSVWNIPLPQNGLQTIASNYDGPLYIVVAKTFYNIEAIKSMFSFSLPVEYYAAHFPFYPVLIALFGTLLNTLFGATFGYPWGMLLTTILSSVFCLFYFRAYISEFVDKKDLLWITFLFAIFPARWLIVRSVGSPEPLFVGMILASIYHFKKGEYLRAGLFGALAQFTKSPAILLFVAYAFHFVIPNLENAATGSAKKWVKSLNWASYPMLLIPLALLSVFYLYKITFNDFFAYFHSGDNIHLLFPPFQIFNFSQPWVNTHWLEEIIFLYLFGVLGVLRLFNKKLGIEAWFTAVFFVSIIFVSHRDLLRYALPISPFIFAAFADKLTAKEFRYAIIFLLLPIYLFSLAFISRNAMPISDWTPLL